MENGYMSGAQLRQYLHISTRKMKYLMDNDYIPHENTGQATHKYIVKTEDAKEFKRRMKYEKDFLSELSGMFSNRKPTKSKLTAEKERQLRVAIIENKAATLPDAITVKQAAELLSVSEQTVRDIIKKHNLYTVKIGSIKVVCKNEIIKIFYLYFRNCLI